MLPSIGFQIRVRGLMLIVACVALGCATFGGWWRWATYRNKAEYYLNEAEQDRRMGVASASNARAARVGRQSHLDLARVDPPMAATHLKDIAFIDDRLAIMARASGYSRLMEAYHLELAAKYRMLAWRPWSRTPADPPPPPRDDRADGPDKSPQRAASTGSG